MQQLEGVMDAAQDHDLNMICFPGGFVNEPVLSESQDTIAFDLADPNALDGYIVQPSVVGYFPDDALLMDFYGCFHPRPIVGFERSIRGIPTVLKDDYAAMCEAIAHLIEIHGHRKIAFISKDIRSPQERDRAYEDTLAWHGIPLEKRLIFDSRDLHELDERLLRPGVDFTALMASDDEFAMGARAYRELHVVFHSGQEAFDLRSAVYHAAVRQHREKRVHRPQQARDLEEDSLRTVAFVEVALDVQAAQEVTRRLLARIAGLEDDLDIGVVPAKLLHDLLSRHPGHVIVQEEEVYWLSLNYREGFGAVRGADDVVTFMLQEPPGCFKVFGIVVHQEYGVA
jgi:hypothetical protein